MKFQYKAIIAVIILVFSWLIFSSNSSTLKGREEINYPGYIQNEQNPAGDTISAQIRAIGQDYIDHENVGLMIGIYRQRNSPNEIPVPEYYSFGHVRNDTASPAPDSLTYFKLGSVEKTFCATILGKIILDTSLHVRLDDLIDKYLPDSLILPRYIDTTVTPHDTVRISLTDLATHYSSLPDEPNNFAVPPNYTIDSLYKFLESYYDSLEYKPGDHYLYSNLGFGLLGDICSGINDTTYLQSAKDIFNELSMPDTKIHLLPQDTGRAAHGYGEHRNPIPDYLRSPSPALEGAGAHWSTMKDMMRFLAFNLRFIPTHLTNILDTLQLWRKDLNNNPVEGQGLAWQIVKLYPDASIYHFTKNGASPDGFTSFITFRKETNTGVVVLSNSKNSPDSIANLVMKLLNPRTTGISGQQEITPEGFYLFQNYPNPFNPNTIINYQLPESNGEYLQVTLKVYDLLGNELTELVNGKQTGVNHSIEFNGSEYPSGVYFYKLTAGNYSMVRKMVLLK